MISLFLALALLSAPEPARDCIFSVTAGEGLDGSGPVSGVGSGVGGCCSDAMYYFGFSGSPGEQFQVEVVDFTDTNHSRTTITCDQSGSAGYYFSPPNPCGTYMISAWTPSVIQGEWEPLRGAYVHITCEEECK